MIIYLHDGTFEGYLTAIYDAYYERNKPDEIKSVLDYNNELYYTPIYIEKDDVKSQKVYDAIKEKIGVDALYNVYYSFLSGNKESNTLAYRYIQLGFKLGKDINLHLHNPIVLNTINTVLRVKKEKHRMLGFVRFKTLINNIYYAAIEPDHDILPLIAPHFSNRLKEERWIIHDLKREKAILHERGQWLILHISEVPNINIYNTSKDPHEDLWKEYFKSTTIEERLNLRQQKSYMPKRYWKHLLETEI